MPQPVDQPYYHLALAMVRQTIMDALNGYGADTLIYLHSPLAQTAIQQALNLSEEGTRWVTCRFIDRLVDVASTKDRHRLRQLIAQRAYIKLRTEGAER